MNLRKKNAQLPQGAYFPAVLLILINLVAGWFIFQDFGLSWDEPLFYQYAEAVPYAYSIPERLSGNFDLEKAYGPSAEDHKTYGPAYLLPARLVVHLLEQVSQASRSELWHLVNFLTFQTGIVLIYALCLRWVTRWAAFGAALLFNTQPVLWGHAWINPKDIPFTVFFLAAVYAGFKMVDRWSSATPAKGTSDSPPANPGEVQQRWRRRQKTFQALALVLLVLLLLTTLFSDNLQAALYNLVHRVYHADPATLTGKLFARLASQASSVPEAAYANKAWIWFTRLRSVLAGLTWLAAIPALLLSFALPALKRLAAWLAVTLAPLPSKPTWAIAGSSMRHWLPITLSAGVLLGAVTSIRILGPLAGLLVGWFFLLRHERRSWQGAIVYAITAIAATYVTWPYLWEAPLGNFIKVVQHMAANPMAPSVLFNGVVTPADQLPAGYLPGMLLITLTLPVVPLFLAGLMVAFRRVIKQQSEWRAMSAVLLWFLIPFIYVLLKRPPIYDGYRHFLFLLPPVFIFTGFIFQAALEKLQKIWKYLPLLTILALPGLVGLISLHPYPYTYYNALVGGTGGAFRRFDTDYWLTCYKETMTFVNESAPKGSTLFALRQPAIAQEYAAPGITIARYDPDDDQTFAGSLLLLTTRTNNDQIYHPEALEWHQVGRAGAVFCVVKEIP